jgi:alpha-L-fucosidase
MNVSKTLSCLVGALFCASVEAAPAYEPNWESLTQHEPPEWLQDAKYGIYAHWGLYSVPAFGSEWYARLLYRDQRPDVMEYHRTNYGSPAEFGYKDFAPLFTAEKFDPDAWAELIKYSGAKYAGLAVVHHDGFLLWHSKVNSWNVGEVGPRRDLYGDLVDSLRRKDLKVIATFHLLRAFDWMTPPPDKMAVAEEEGWDLLDPAFRDIYWTARHREHSEFLDEWKRKVREVIDTYQPDALWFDGGKFREEGVEETVMGNLAYYLNKETDWGRGLEVLNKYPTSRKFNFDENFGMLTFEEGRDRGRTVPRPWIDDMKISTRGWGYLHDPNGRFPDPQRRGHLQHSPVDHSCRGQRCTVHPQNRPRSLGLEIRQLRWIGHPVHPQQGSEDPLRARTWVSGRGQAQDCLAWQRQNDPHRRHPLSDLHPLGATARMETEQGCHGHPASRVGLIG